MIKINVAGDWATLDTLNGYYCLEDLWAAYGKPEGFDPRTFLRTCGPHRRYTMQSRRKVWCSQAKVYQYAAWVDPKFNAIMAEALETKDVELAKQIATGVIHK